MNTFHLTEKVERLMGIASESWDLPCVRSLRWEGDRWWNATDIAELLTQLDAMVASDQKQEAYRGLRQFLHAMSIASK